MIIGPTLLYNEPRVPPSVTMKLWYYNYVVYILHTFGTQFVTVVSVQKLSELIKESSEACTIMC